MIAKFGGALALALSLWAGATPAAAQPAPNAAQGKAARDLLARFEALESMKDAKAAHAEALKLTRDPQFAKLPPEGQGLAWTMASWLALRANDAALALQDIEHAVSPTAPAMVWRIRFLSAASTNNILVATDSLKVLIERFPREATSLPDEMVVRAVGLPATQPEQEAAQRALAEVLLDQWRPQDPFYVTDAMLSTAVRGRLASGRLPAARALASEISARGAAILLRADKQYDGLTTDGQWSQPTPRQATEARLSAVRILRARYPQRLSGVLREAGLLDDLDADAEALSVVEQALAKLKADPGAFEDTERYRSWLEEKRANLLTTLGRNDAGTEAMRAAAARSERGADNVSNVLNLSMRMAYENPTETIRLTDLAAGRDISDYGRGVGLASRTCAYAHLNERAKAEDALAQLMRLKAKADVGLSPAFAAWCLGDEAGSARVMIEQFADPKIRSRAIISLQVDVPQQAGERSADDRDQDKMMVAMAARPDVQAALAPYGRTIHLTRDDLFRPGP